MQEAEDSEGCPESPASNMLTDDVEIVPGVSILKVMAGRFLHGWPMVLHDDLLMSASTTTAACMHVQGRLSSQETSRMLQEEGLAESDLIPGKYEGERCSHYMRQQ